MARYRTIDIRIWMDSKFMGLDEGSQLLFIYLLTCPHVNQLGTIPMSEVVLAAYLNKPIETVSKRLRNLSDMGLIRIDNGNLIWICNFLKYNAPANPNCAKGLLAFFDEIPDCPLVDDVAESVVKACELKGSDYLKAVLPSLQKYLDRKKNRNGSETVPKPFRNQEQEQEQEQKEKVEKKEKTRETAKRLVQSLEKPEGVSDDLWQEWVAHKKRVSKTCTQRMVNSLVREAGLAGMTPAQAMELQLEKGWVGFEASYVHNRNGNSQRHFSLSQDIPFDQRDYSEGINDDNSF